MTEPQFHAIMATLTPQQLTVLQLCIMAERRLRTHHRATPDDNGALNQAYAWARSQVPHHT